MYVNINVYQYYTTCNVHISNFRAEYILNVNTQLWKWDLTPLTPFVYALVVKRTLNHIQLINQSIYFIQVGSLSGETIIPTICMYLMPCRSRYVSSWSFIGRHFNFGGILDTYLRMFALYSTPWVETFSI